MPERLFVFIQFEFPWALGPAAGRYLLRAADDGEPERVVVLGDLEAPRLPIGRGGGRGRRAARTPRPADPEAAPVLTTRVTVIDPISLSADSQGHAWLGEMDREHEILAATAIVNRVMHSHRVAEADPYLHEVSPAQAAVIRAGWGEGEQVADGDWRHAVELEWTGGGPWEAGSASRPRRRRRDRTAALRPQERLAALLGGRTSMLMCEELALRARLDLDQGRLRHAAVQLQGAYEAALAELGAENRQDLAIRLAELQQLDAQVRGQAAAALADGGSSEELDEEVVGHALGRLEAALRARTAAGFNLG